MQILPTAIHYLVNLFFYANCPSKCYFRLHIPSWIKRDPRYLGTKLKGLGSMSLISGIQVAALIPYPQLDWELGLAVLGQPTLLAWY